MRQSATQTDQGANARKARAALKDPVEAAANARKSIPAGHLKKKAAERKKSMGPISRMESYPQNDFMRRTGMRDKAFRTALANGLKITRISGEAWITGEDYFDYLRAQAKTVTVLPVDDPDDESEE